jgi:hypothetical protein
MDSADTYHTTFTDTKGDGHKTVTITWDRSYNQYDFMAKTKRTTTTTTKYNSTTTTTTIETVETAGKSIERQRPHSRSRSPLPAAPWLSFA